MFTNPSVHQGWNEFIHLNAFNECIHEFIHLKKFNNWIIHKLFLCDYKIEDKKTAHAKKFVYPWVQNINLNVCWIFHAYV